MQFYIFSQAAEQAKASPALVAKDPSTSTNKKEEEDLAKGKELMVDHYCTLKCLSFSILWQWRNAFEEACKCMHTNTFNSLFTL